MQQQKLKAEERELRELVHSSRFEAGIRALHDLAVIERDKALRVWRTARGPEDMARHQAQYNAMQSIIDFIMVAPAELPR